MAAVERLGPFLAFSPLLVDRWKTGRWPSSSFDLALNAAVGCAIILVAMLMGYARRKTRRVADLRRTLNETIVHDLKNPMATIMGAVSCILENPLLESGQRSTLASLALRSCRSQMTLLETLLDTSRLEDGELVAKRQPIRTRALLDACMGDVQGAASYAGVKLRSSRADGVPEEIYGDPDLLARALSNLLHNAVKYTPRDGDVRLNVRSGDTGMLFEIDDAGPGIPPEHIGNLFKKYYRVEGSDQSGRHGSGLGLYFCRLAVEAHGGSVAVESEVGRGTRVTFNIPQPAAKERSAPAVERILSDPRPSGC